MKILIACEESGSMREAFKSQGHEVTSCDLQSSSSPGDTHYQGDVLELIDRESFDFMMGFPPCTYLSKAQTWMCNKDVSRALKRDQAVLFVRSLLSSGIPHIALENPPGYLSSALRPYDQIIRPHDFGDPYHKEVCLWLHNMPPIVPRAEDRLDHNYKSKSINNHTNSRMKQPQRAKIRSSWKYYPKMCQAIAIQWSIYLKSIS